MKIHHLGIAVKSLEMSCPIFQKILGAAGPDQEVVEDQKVRVATFQVGESRIELLEATAADSPIARHIEKRGQGLHHLAFAVPELEKTLRDLECDGVRLIDREPRPGAGGERIAFLHPSSTAGILIELVEERASKKL